MRQLPILALTALSFTGCRLTAEDVRELIKNPTGEIDKATMNRVASGAALSDTATTAEDAAYTFKNLGQANAEKIDLADVFCVGNTVADSADFAGCADEDKECEADLVIDSCLLRVGEADEDARGKIKFSMDRINEANFTQTKLAISFEDWEATREDDGGTTDLFKGITELETRVFKDDEKLESEAVFTADVERIVRRKERGWFFDDGVEDWKHAIAGVRATVNATEEDANGTLEVVAFVDEGGGRSQGVVIRVTGEGHKVDADQIAATVNVELEGANGKFSCNFDELDVSSDRDGLHVQTKGACEDEDGDSFDFEGDVLEK